MEAGLNIEKINNLYKGKCEKEKQHYVKSSFYCYVFNTSFNVDFHLPKTDRCEKCESVKLKKSENIAISKEEMQSDDLHIEEKLAMRKEKTKDKLNGNKNFYWLYSI